MWCASWALEFIDFHNRVIGIVIFTPGSFTLEPLSYLWITLMDSSNSTSINYYSLWDELLHPLLSNTSVHYFFLREREVCSGYIVNIVCADCCKSLCIASAFSTSISSSWKHSKPISPEQIVAQVGAVFLDPIAIMDERFYTCFDPSSCDKVNFVGKVQK